MNTWLGWGMRGAVIWAVPLAISFFFYTPTGELTISYPWFKSIMVVVLTLVTLAVNLIRPARRGSPGVVAAVYTGISLLLDLLVLVPLLRLSLAAYIEQIALIYIIIFAITWAVRSRPAALRPAAA